MGEAIGNEKEGFIIAVLDTVGTNDTETFN
jgi:hypothetical protein